MNKFPTMPIVRRYNPFLFENAPLLIAHTQRKSLTPRLKWFLECYFSIRPAVAPISQSILEAIQREAIYEADRDFASSLLARWFPR